MCEYFEFAVLENKTLADNRRTVFVDSPPVSLLLHFFQTHQLFPQSLWHLCSLQIKATDQSIWMADSSLKCKTYYTGHFTERFSSVLCQTVLTNSISMWTTLHVHACGREGASWWWEDEMMDGIPGSLLPDLDQSFRWTKEVRQTCGPGIGTNIQVLLIECRPTVLKKQKCCPSVESVMVLLLQKNKKRFPEVDPAQTNSINTGRSSWYQYTHTPVPSKSYVALFSSHRICKTFRKLDLWHFWFPVLWWQQNRSLLKCKGDFVSQLIFWNTVCVCVC